ncbi:Zinc finger CCCH domain-containing protein 4 [Schistosoma japonicum]|nr:Zinc finger CCCH domain-containing protein 4 [Schistosoma japonicum]
MTTIDFEEGEVEDLSGSDHEDSGHEYKDCNPPKVALHKSSKRRRHSQQNSKKTRCSQRESDLSGDRNTEPLYKEDINSMSSRERSKLPILEFLSEDEDMAYLMDREKFVTPKSSGSSRKKKKRRKDGLHRPNSQSRCRYYMDGRCSKGSSCPFLHDFVPAKKHELCKFYAVGMCSKESACSYLHGEFPCKFFHLTNDCHHGDDCKFSHAPLTDFTRSLLEKITPKLNVDRCSDKPGYGRQTDSKLLMNVRSRNDDHGDVDYRFGQKPPQMNVPSDRELATPDFCPQRMPVLTPNLFAPICTSGHRHFRPEHDPLRTRGMRPFNMNPGDQMPQTVYPKNDRCFPPPRPYGPVPFQPQHVVTNTPYSPTVNGFRPPSLLDTPHRCPPPRMIPPRMRTMDPANMRFPRFRPRCETFYAPGVRPPIRSTFDTVHEEAIVSSELDMMAALLASSKSMNDDCKNDSNTPPLSPTRGNENNLQPETASPPQSSLKTETEAIPSNTLVEDNLVPEFTTNTQIHVLPPQGPAPWRLIPLNMTVKIPYPLMQLPVDDLPYRYEDPRLRGQLTTFRLQPQSKLSLGGDPENAKCNDEPESQNHNEINIIRANEENSDAYTQKRPIKLQLHEMANTFANTPSDHLHVSNRQGDRSYLDDPRFRRRRVMVPPTTTQSASNVLSQSNPNSTTQTTQECLN